MGALKRILGSKFGWACVLGHAVLFAYALFLRGGPFHAFHAYYEPWLLLALMLLDFIWFFIWFLVLDFIFPTASNPRTSTYILVVGAAIASIQWLYIGHVIEKKFGKQRKPPRFLAP